MSRARYLVGDVRAMLDTIPDGSIDFMMSSPPFIGLRDYLPAGHPNKSLEIGSEPTPAEFITVLLDVVARLRPKLAPHASIAVELGDTYAGRGGAGGDYNEGGWRGGLGTAVGSARATRKQPPNTAHRLNDDGSLKTSAARRALEPKALAQTLPVNAGEGWPLDKSKALIPELFRVALVYGIHPLTGEISPAGRWRCRNVVTWARTNPPVGALGDKWRPGTSDIVVACLAADRYWDEVSTRRPASPNTNNRVGKNAAPRTDLPSQQRDGNWSTLAAQNAQPGSTAPLLDWWQISAGGYNGAHFAVYPPELCVDPITAMCPRQVCVTCGEPSRPIVETSTTPNRATNGPASVERRHIEGGSPGYEVRADSDKRIVGWTDCGHRNWRRGVVLDIFAGTGTTLLVAIGLGRDAIGFDIDERNVDLAADRIGMFLDVEYPTIEMPA